jgi:hypothetical protein
MGRRMRGVLFGGRGRTHRELGCILRVMYKKLPLLGAGR